MKRAASRVFSGKSVCSLVVFALLMGVFAAPADSDDCPELAGAWPWPYGQVNAVAVSEDHVYFGVDRVLVVAEVSDAAQPVVVGTVQLPLPATDIVVSHSYVFVGTEGEGLRIVDVHEPEAPVEVAVYMPPHGDVMGLSVDGSNLWAAVDSDGLRVLDITQPTAPVVVASGGLGEVGSGMDIEVVSPFAYMATGIGMRVLQASGSLETIHWTRKATHRVAVSDGYVFGLSDSGHLTAFDGRLGWVAEADLDGRNGRLAVSDGYLYAACGADLKVFEAGAPQFWSMVPPGAHATGAGAFDVAVTEGRAYLAAGAGGLQNLDVGEPMEPAEIGRVETVGTVLDAVNAGGLTYVVDCLYPGSNDHQPHGPCTLRILDLSSGAAPTEVGSMEISDVPAEIVVSNGSAFVLSDVGLRIIDVSNPSDPVEVSAESWPSVTTTGFDVADGYAFITTIQVFSGLRVWDVRVPSSPEIVSWIEGGFSDVSVFGDLVFLSGIGDQAGLWVYDVSNPFSPTEVGYSETPGDPRHIAVSGGYAFLTEGDYHSSLPSHDPQVWIYDLSVPTAPTLTGTFEAMGSYHELILDIDASGGHFYLATERGDTTSGSSVIDVRSGVRTVDVRDPSSPESLGFYETKGDAKRVSVTPRGDVIAADGWVGFEVLDTRGCAGFIPPPGNVRRPAGRVVP